MDYVKFNGIIKKIQDAYYKDFDIKNYLKNELNISSEKASTLSERINRIYDFEQFWALFSKMKQVSPKNNAIKKTKTPIVDKLQYLSQKEFEGFLKWFFHDIGYQVSYTKLNPDDSVFCVMTKDKEKIAVYAKKFQQNNMTLKLDLTDFKESSKNLGCNRFLIVTNSFLAFQTEQEALKLNIDVWDHTMLSTKMKEEFQEVNKSQEKIEFPRYTGSLYRSLLNLKTMDIFIIKMKGAGSYDIYKRGIRYPILSFKVRPSSEWITRVSYRIRNNEPIPGYGVYAHPLIWSDRGYKYYGDGCPADDSVAYNKIVKYLSQFV